MVRVTKADIIAVEGPLGTRAERLSDGRYAILLDPMHVEDLMEVLANDVPEEVGVETMAVFQLLSAFGHFEPAE
jgi:hypothetical protein